MPKRYSIAEARHNLAAIVHELETEPAIELTRRGTPVAVLLSMEEYSRRQTKASSFWPAYLAFREGLDPALLDESPEPFAGLRDRSPGREVTF